jgi:hypothetical protein
MMSWGGTAILKSVANFFKYRRMTSQRAKQLYPIKGVNNFFTSKLPYIINLRIVCGNGKDNHRIKKYYDTNTDSSNYHRNTLIRLVLHRNITCSCVQTWTFQSIKALGSIG